MSGDALRDAAVLAHQNAVLNRFEQMVRDFQNAERLSSFEAMNMLLASVAHNIGHGVRGSNADFEQMVAQFIARVRQERAEHKRDCSGKAH